MKKQDPKELKARHDREQAQARLNMVLEGIGRLLPACSSRRFYEGEANAILDLIDSDLKPAIASARKAEEAYFPFYSRRRISRPRRFRKAKTA